MEAPWEAPPADGVTIWHVSDTHVTPDGVPVWSMPRLDAVAADMNTSGMCSRVDARLHTGDITEHGRADQVALAKAWLDQNFTDPADIVVGGNHDLGNGWADYAKPRSAVETDYGRPMLSDAYMGRAGAQTRVVGITVPSFPVSDDPVVRATWTFDQATLDWLDARLSEDTSTPTFIACHYYLSETGSSSVKGSQPAAQLNDLIASNPQVCSWLCGHSHFAVTDPRTAQMQNLGGRSIPQIQAPSTAHTSGSGGYEFDARYPFRSLFLTYRDSDRIEVRYRDHGARQWVAGYEGQMVTVLNPS